MEISNKIKQEFFQAVAVSVQLYGCTTWTLMKCLESKLDRKYTRMLHAVLNKSRKQHCHKTAALWPLASHLKNHPSKTNKSWIFQCWPTSKDLYLSAVCRDCQEWWTIGIIIIIITLSRNQHGYPWPSPATLLYRPLLTAGPQNHIHIGTELLYVGSSWSSCLSSAMWRGPQEYITHELVHTSPAVFRMSGSSNLDSFHDGY